MPTEHESRRAEAVTAAQELRTLYATAPCGMCTLDADLRFVRVNEHLAEINGLSVEEHLGRTVREVVPQLAGTAEPLLREVLETGEPKRNLEISGETPAQPGVRRTWSEDWHPILGDEGEVIGIQIFAREITQRKQAEEALEASRQRFHTALQHAPVVFAYVDPELRYEWIFNPHPDFDPSGVLGRRDDELDRGPGIQALMDLKARVLEQGVQERARIAFERSDGRRWYDITATPVVDDQGQAVKLVTASLDVTEQMLAEEALQKLMVSLEERVEERTRQLEAGKKQVEALASELTLAEQAERRHVAQVLHDGLQQQLYATQFPLAILQKEAASVGQEGLQEMATLAYTYLADAIKTARQLMVDLSPPVLQGEGLFEALQWLCAQMEERYGLQAELRDGDGLQVPGADMRVLLFQIVRELLHNVVQHAQTDRVFMSLTQANGELAIDVVDEGLGFDPSAADGEAPSSMGLGLRHARERLGLFGGRLTITSRPGSTHVAIRVPLSRL